MQPSRRQSGGRSEHPSRPAWRELRALASERFGVRHFRPGQRELIEAALAGRDALGVLPTGAGKSLCYQLPALVLDGPVLVVSPLIALMQDQTEKLLEHEVPAEQLNSTLAREEERSAERRICHGEAELIYVTPERLQSEEHLAVFKRRKIALFVIDEAHCISQWGHDFRPAYLGLRQAIEALGRPPVMALTATAPPEVMDDIVRQLGLERPRIVHTGIERENLFFAVTLCDRREDKFARLQTLIADAKPPGIIYVATIRLCEELHRWLLAHGIPAARYHGRLAAEERELAQQRFMGGDVPIIVATSAFGLGIDKPDIGFVAHWNYPDSVETYYQEAGRAGRDGSPARAELLYRKEDRRIQSYFIGGKYPRRDALMRAWEVLAPLKVGESISLTALAERCALAPRRAQVIAALLEDMGLAERGRGRLRKVRNIESAAEMAQYLDQHERLREADRERLAAMIRYAQTALCRMQFMREAMGEPPGAPCGHCDNCARGTSAMRGQGAPVADVEPASAEVVALHPGDHVRHPDFGLGEVTWASGDTITVAFATGERKVQAEQLAPG